MTLPPSNESTTPVKSMLMNKILLLLCINCNITSSLVIADLYRLMSLGTANYTEVGLQIKQHSFRESNNKTVANVCNNILIFPM